MYNESMENRTMTLGDFLAEVATEDDLKDYELIMEFPFLDGPWPPTKNSTERPAQSVEVDHKKKTVTLKAIRY